MDQQALPLLMTLRDCAQRPHAPFYTPGHKRGRGIPAPMRELLGDRPFLADLPELPELDNLFAPEGAILQAQELAADLFGAAQTWFLANGSTCGIEAAVLATCGPGDALILPRNCHQAAIAALVLSGAIPVFVQPDYDPDWGIAHGVSPGAIAATLAQHPNAKAVMLVYPTYYGACGDIGAIAQLAHQRGIPLIVDEAHGAHFAFHPDFPTPSLAAGADIVVQSTHKVLGAMTQASMLHCQGDRVEPDRLSRALRLVQSTSPSYLLLASLDAARWQLAQHGLELMQRTLDLAAIARTQLAQIPNLRLLTADQACTPGFIALDPTRLTVDVSGLGLSGFAADEILHTKLGVTAELPGLTHLSFILSLGNTLADIEQLVTGFQILAQSVQPADGLEACSPCGEGIAHSAIEAEPVLSPRAAFLARSEVVPLEQAGDRLAAETVCPYPPGIPLLIPGERISRGALQLLKAVLAQGGTVTGLVGEQGLRVVQRNG
ncbi:MAG: aminotransferase class I/II-fold pyridoxal phosphate-dependent enzyme [Thermoleptolyngbya sp. C42_A2020_037]|nr:aminotransferase class I/II-fold pyridoxal phosphate-dependent enzyme [Thermoleptolyngbya sp. C42_A2020_037]